MIEQVPWSKEEEITTALNNTTYNGKKTSTTSTKDRVTILEKLSLLLDQHQQQLATLITTETGKPITDALQEIQRASFTTKNVSQELATLKGETYYSEGKYCLSRRVPYGLVLAIAPFNFPVNLAVHKIIPAYAMGNTILLKPHPQCYQTTKKLIELCWQAGMLPSDIQFIYPNNELLQKTLQDERIDLVSFTGGTSTAKILSKHCGIKKTLFELGGNDALVVMPDADITKVVQTLLVQRFRCAGQRCNAPKRIFVHKKSKNDLIHSLLVQMKTLKIGDPQDRDTDVGPVITTASKDTIIKKIQTSIKMGARSLHPWTSKNTIISPVLLDNIELSMPVVSDETFGPVVSLIEFTDENSVIEMINSSRLGLQCGIFSQDLNLLKKFFEEVHVGAVLANEGPAYRLDHFPFGGFKDSGHGREGTSSAMLEFSSVKNFIF